MKYDLIASKEYEPTAIYYEDSDSLEYLRVSMPVVYRRIDPTLTLILTLESRELVGFKLKGFKNFYMRHIKQKFQKNCPEFIELVDLLQEITSNLGAEIFEENRKTAYSSALEMAAIDNVHVRDLPRVVAS